MNRIGNLHGKFTEAKRRCSRLQFQPIIYPICSILVIIFCNKVICNIILIKRMNQITFKNTNYRLVFVVVVPIGFGRVTVPRISSRFNRYSLGNS